MPYTHLTWDDTKPEGSDLLSTGDDSIRDEKLDLKERIETFFTDIDADPWVPKAGAVTADAIADGSIGIDKLDPALNFRTILQLATQVSGTLALPMSTLTKTFTVAGAELGDQVVATFGDGVLIAGPVTIEAAYVSAADTVTVVFRNMTQAGYVGPDPGGGPITISSLPDNTVVVTSITMTNRPLLIAVIKVGVPGELHPVVSPLLPGTEFNPQDDTQSIGYSVSEVFPGYIGPLTLFGSITIPPGVKIVGANLQCRSLNTATVTGNLYQVTSTGVATSLCAFAAVVGGGAQTLNQVFTYVVAVGDIFTFQIKLDSTGSVNPDDARLSWAQILTA